MQILKVEQHGVVFSNYDAVNLAPANLKIDEQDRRYFCPLKISAELRQCLASDPIETGAPMWI
jgi:hypothetical protein